MQVLYPWWPRLLPGIAAGATHGAIRVGHAVRGLREVETVPRVTELAHAFAYWAARWQALPVVHGAGTATAAALLNTVPRVAEQSGGIRVGLAQLGGTLGWDTHAARLAAPRSAAEVPLALDALVDAAVAAYPSWAHGGPTMLVHAATAPNAVAAYRPATSQPIRGVMTTPEDVLARPSPTAVSMSSGSPTPHWVPTSAPAHRLLCSPR